MTLARVSSRFCRVRRGALAVVAVLAAVPLSTAATAAAASAQLVTNPSVETVSTSSTSLPLGWTKVSSGKFRLTQSYPSADAHTGTRFVRSTMSSYTSGHAGWRVSPVGVVAGQTYAFSTWYRAGLPTSIYAEFRTSAGVATYQLVSTSAAAASWTQVTASITVPAGTATMSVMHRLAGVGTLDVDDTTLTGEAPGSSLATPAAPTVCATAVSQLSVSWAAVAGATSYDVSYGIVGATSTTLSGVTSTTRALTGLAAGTYSVSVRAVNATSTSAWSPATTSTAVSASATSLVLNGSFELSDSTCQAPLQWIKGGWGTNTRVLSSPASSAATGSRFGRVVVSGYSSGDAKWAFDHVPVTAGGTYVFSDRYRSDVSSQWTIEYRSSGGV
ncbi:MAG: hypothetical protein ACO3C1_11780, partial [Ilumatobacteraceae bacterium]